ICAHPATPTLHSSPMRRSSDLPNERLAVGLGHPVPGFDPVLGLDRRVELRLEVRLVIAVVVHLRCHDHSTLGCALVRTCPVSVCDRRARSEDPHDRRPAATRSIHLLTICSVLLASSVAYGTSGCNAGARRSAMPARLGVQCRRGGLQPASRQGRRPASILRTGPPAALSLHTGGDWPHRPFAPGWLTPPDEAAGGTGVATPPCPAQQRNATARA